MSDNGPNPAYYKPRREKKKSTIEEDNNLYSPRHVAQETIPKRQKLHELVSTPNSRFNRIVDARYKENKEKK
jgi:hypothetical protein